MTEEQINSIPILDFIEREDFFSLSVHLFEGQEYWELTFRGKRKGNSAYFTFEDSLSPHDLFKIFKPKIKKL